MKNDSIQKNKIVWAIYETDKTIEAAGKLALALAERKSEEIIGFLRDAKLSRSLIVRRGENNRYFEILKQAADFWLKEKFGPEKDFEKIEKKELLRYLHESKIPEQLLAELTDIAYHQRNEKEFFDMINLIEANEKLFINRAVIAKALHNLASWHGSHGELNKSIEVNKRALALAREIGETVIEAKAKFGIYYAKGMLKKAETNKDYVKPGQQADDFLRLADVLDKEGLTYDSVRAKIEAAKAMLKLADRQEKLTRAETLKAAKNLALNALCLAKDLSYPNAEILAREVLSRIYEKMADARKDRSYRKSADVLSGLFNFYHTKNENNVH